MGGYNFRVNFIIARDAALCLLVAVICGIIRIPQKEETYAMLYNERAEVILQQLQLQSTVKVTELSQLLQVSVDTVRRDLKNMEQEGRIKYVRGGACLPEDGGGRPPAR